MDTPHPEKSSTASGELAHDFVQFSLNAGVLKFGSFQTKAGRMSPYFFNAGLFDDGAKLSALAGFYAKCIIASGIEFDVLFGPAYKGISLAAAVAIELARMGRNVPFAYNRKEAKTHGEGGVMVGAAIAGRVLIVDDVISAGTATRESMALIAACAQRWWALPLRWTDKKKHALAVWIKVSVPSASCVMNTACKCAQSPH